MSWRTQRWKAERNDTVNQVEEPISEKGAALNSSQGERLRKQISFFSGFPLEERDEGDGAEGGCASSAPSTPS
jgi:hypothetical protein